jgi:hypothetical protein
MDQEQVKQTTLEARNKLVDFVVNHPKTTATFLVISVALNLIQLISKL